MRINKSLVLSALAGLAISGHAAAQDLQGTWRGEFSIRDNIRAPFNFEVTGDGMVFLLNGSERFQTSTLRREGDSVFIALDQFDNELAFHAGEKRLTGVLRKQDHSGVPVPVTATKGERNRFINRKPASADISGRYSVRFKFESGKEEESVALFEQKGNQLTGTFLKPSGDSRFLEGVVEGNRFYLSSFIGSSPGYYEGSVTKDGKIWGFQAGTRVKYLFDGHKNDSATIADPYAVTGVKSKDSAIHFSLPGLNGDTVSLSDEKYRNKVVIIAVTGTWCPNCVDEAAFLSPWYKKNKEKGVEVVTVHFERQTDTAFTRKVMTRFRKRFDITYDQVFGGLANSEAVMAALQGLNDFSSFPTTIFVDKRGKVRRIHSGYSGPATGEFYEKFVSDFEREVEELVREN